MITRLALQFYVVSQSSTNGLLFLAFLAIQLSYTVEGILQLSEEIVGINQIMLYLLGVYTTVEDGQSIYEFMTVL